MYACLRGQERVVQLLIARGADPRDEDKVLYVFIYNVHVHAYTMYMYMHIQCTCTCIYNVHDEHRRQQIKQHNTTQHNNTRDNCTCIYIYT